MDATGWMKGLKVTGDGTGVVSHAGVALVRALADATGLTKGLSRALASARLLVHDRGQVLADLACAIADGGEAISDFRVIGDQDELFGLVASVPTAWRALSEIAAGGEAALGRITAAVNSARRTAWARAVARHGALPGARIADKTLAGVTCLRLDAACRRKLMVTVDGAGASHDLVTRLDKLAAQPGCQVIYSVGWELGKREKNAIAQVPEEAWQIAVDGRGEIRERRAEGACADRQCAHRACWVEEAHVTELTALLREGPGGDRLAGWPAKMRIFARRERPHPGAQLTLFEIEDGYRYSLWVTNLPKTTRGWRANPAYIDAAHRVHARVEDGILLPGSFGCCMTLRQTPGGELLQHSSATVVLVVVADQQLGPRERATCATPQPGSGGNLITSLPAWFAERPYLHWFPPPEKHPNGQGLRDRPVPVRVDGDEQGLVRRGADRRHAAGLAQAAGAGRQARQSRAEDAASRSCTRPGGWCAARGGGS